MAKTALALMMGLACASAAAEWQPFSQDRTLAVHYEIGLVRKADGGLVFVEYHRMATQVGGSGLVALDQFVAVCREHTHTLAMLLKTQGSVHRDGGQQVVTLHSEKFDPPKEIPETDRGATDLAIAVCAAALL